jgi:hypothetical protein
MPAPFWAKDNKAAEKWTEKEVEDAFISALDYVTNDESVILKSEVDLHLLIKFGISPRTRSNWVKTQYNNNRCVADVWQAIDLTIENRVVKDKEVLRSNIQALVIQTKHNYKERSESENKIVVKMPSVEIDGKEVKFDID